MVSIRRTPMMFAAATALLLAACGSGETAESTAPRTKNAVASSSMYSQSETTPEDNDDNYSDDAPPDIVLVGLGDSFGSGEGFPATGSGSPSSTKWWGLTKHRSPGSERCHRSSKAAFVQAAMELQRQYPTLNIYWRHFACTGAQTEHLSDTNYDATVDENGGAVMMPLVGSQVNRPQIDDAIEWVNKLNWGSRPKKIDAIYMSIGGNDVGGWQESSPINRRLGLGSIISKCIEPSSQDCDEGTGPDGKATFIRNAGNYAASKGSTGLRAAYRRMNTLIDQKLASAGISLREKLLNAYPNLVQSDVIDPATSTNAYCGDEGVGTPHDPVGRMDVGLLANSDQGDWRFVNETVMAPVKQAQIDIATELGWDLVRYDSAANESRRFDTYAAWTTHGVCATVNWVHDLVGAANLQGDDLDVTGPINASFGAFHPNQLGWLDFAKRAFYHLDKVVRTATSDASPSASGSSGSSAAAPMSIDILSLRPTLPSEMSPASSAAVPSSLRTDSDGILTVSAAAWGAGSGLKSLEWTISVGGRSIQCTNCAFLSDSTKKIVKEVLSGNAGRYVTAVRGFDPAIKSVGDPRGFGWSAEFLVSSKEGGNAVADWVLACPSGSTCRSVTLNAGEMLWNNRFWGIEASCNDPLATRGPVAAYPNANLATTDSLEKRMYALDRVMVAAPEYIGVYEGGGGTRRLVGWRETGCAS